MEENKVVAVLEEVISGEEMLTRLGGPMFDARRESPVQYSKSKLPDNDDIERSAQMVLDYTGSLDPTWADRIRIGREEKEWTARQFIGAMLGWMLDRSYHLEAPAHSAFEPGVQRFGERECEWKECRKKFTPKVPGQRFCSNECGSGYERSIAPPPPPKKQQQQGIHNRA